MQFNSISSGSDGRSFQQTSQHEYLNMSISQVPIKSNSNAYGQNYEAGSNIFSGNRNYASGPNGFPNQSQAIQGANQQAQQQKIYTDGNASVIYNPSRNNWECAVCHKSFRERKDLDQHLNSRAHEPIQYACNQCGKGFASIGALTLHAEQAGHVHAFSGQSPTGGQADTPKEGKPIIPINKSNSYGNMMNAGVSSLPAGTGPVSSGFKQQGVIGTGGRIMNHTGLAYGNGGGAMMNNNNKMRFTDNMQGVGYNQPNYSNSNHDGWSASSSPGGQYGIKTNGSLLSDCEFCSEKCMNRNDLRVHMMREHNMSMSEDRDHPSANRVGGSNQMAMMSGGGGGSYPLTGGGPMSGGPMSIPMNGVPARYGQNNNNNNFSSMPASTQYAPPPPTPPPRNVMRGLSGNFPEGSPFAGSAASFGSTGTGVTDNSAASTANGSYAHSGNGDPNWSPGSTPMMTMNTAPVQIGTLYFGGLCKADTVGAMIGGCSWWIADRGDVMVIQGSLPVKLSNITLVRVEYEGLLNGLKMALLRGFRSLVVRGSSESILNHLFEDSQGQASQSQYFRSMYPHLMELKEAVLSFFPQFERLEFELVSVEQNLYVHQMADTIIASCIRRQNQASSMSASGPINAYAYSNVTFNPSGTTPRAASISHSASLDSSIHSFVSREEKTGINAVSSGVGVGGGNISSVASINEMGGGERSLTDAFGSFSLQGSALSFFPNDTAAASGASSMMGGGGGGGGSLSSNVDDLTSQTHSRVQTSSNSGSGGGAAASQYHQPGDLAYDPFRQSLSMFNSGNNASSAISDAHMRGISSSGPNSLFGGSGGNVHGSGSRQIGIPGMGTGGEYSSHSVEHSSAVSTLDSNDPVFTTASSPLSSSFGRTASYSSVIGVGRSVNTDSSSSVTATAAVAVVTSNDPKHIEDEIHKNIPNFMSEPVNTAAVSADNNSESTSGGGCEGSGQ